MIMLNSVTFAGVNVVDINLLQVKLGFLELFYPAGDADA